MKRSAVSLESLIETALVSEHVSLFTERDNGISDYCPLYRQILIPNTGTRHEKQRKRDTNRVKKWYKADHHTIIFMQIYKILLFNEIYY